MAIFFVNWCLNLFIENITEERLYLDRFNRFLKFKNIKNLSCLIFEKSKGWKIDIQYNER